MTRKSPFYPPVGMLRPSVDSERREAAMSQMAREYIAATPYNVIRTARAMLSDNSGQGLVEYSLIIALVAIVAIVSLKVLGKRVSNALSNAARYLS